nr:uncharacterized protein LOC115255679 [Aedes albopictus]
MATLVGAVRNSLLFRLRDVAGGGFTTTTESSGLVLQQQQPGNVRVCWWDGYCITAHNPPSIHSPISVSLVAKGFSSCASDSVRFGSGGRRRDDGSTKREDFRFRLVRVRVACRGYCGLKRKRRCIDGGARKISGRKKVLFRKSGWRSVEDCSLWERADDGRARGRPEPSETPFCAAISPTRKKENLENHRTIRDTISSLLGWNNVEEVCFMTGRKKKQII